MASEGARVNRTQRTVVAMAWAVVVGAIVLGVTSPDAPAEGAWLNFAPEGGATSDGSGGLRTDPWIQAGAWAIGALVAGGGALVTLRGWPRAQRVATLAAAAVVLLAPVVGFDAARTDQSGDGALWAVTVGTNVVGYSGAPTGLPAGSGDLTDVSPWVTVGLVVVAVVLWLALALWLLRDRSPLSVDDPPAPDAQAA